MAVRRSSRLAAWHVAAGVGAFALAAGVFGAVPAASAAPTSERSVSVGATGSAEPVEAVTRSQVIERAQGWLDPPVPYSMEEIHESGYRQDCSGYVSMAWGTPAPGDSTITLPDHATKIDASELQAGDVVMKGGPGTGGADGHVAIFEKWVDEAHTAYMAYEQKGGDIGQTVHREVPYPYFDGGEGYEPYRFNEITDG